MKLEVYDSSGKNIEHTGEPGELVVTRPHPSVPLYFWGDTTGEKFRSAYFDMFPGESDSLFGALILTLSRCVAARRFCYPQPDHSRLPGSRSQVRLCSLILLVILM